MGFRRRVQRRAQAARPQTSPGDAKPNAPLDHEELEPDGQIAYRSVSARLAHLSSDRPRADFTRLKRIGRDLLHTPRAVWDFPLQDEESTVTIDGFFEADAAGCPKTRRSTSGGSLHIGRHILAASSTQKVVSLSSAESKDYSMVRCASEAIGLINTLRELGHEAHVRIWTDAAAARGLAFRSGSGPIKHMETRYFWLQQKEKNQGHRIDKIRGTTNPSDLMTKHLDGKRVTMLCDSLSIKHICGRPSSALKLTLDTSPASDDTGETGSSERNRCACCNRT